MGFLKRLFGDGQGQEYVDKQGLYFHVECDKCGSKVRVRADKQHDINRKGQGYIWHKTIVDSRCFRHIPVVVQMDGAYRVISQEIEGGRFISKEEFDAPEPTEETSKK